MPPRCSPQWPLPYCPSPPSKRCSPPKPSADGILCHVVAWSIEALLDITLIHLILVMLKHNRFGRRKRNVLDLHNNENIILVWLSYLIPPLFGGHVLRWNSDSELEASLVVMNTNRKYIPNLYFQFVLAKWSVLCAGRQSCKHLVELMLYEKATQCSFTVKVLSGGNKFKVVVKLPSWWRTLLFVPKLMTKMQFWRIKWR